jgi:Arc/MetJ-type ribon-helix-helix transcriptional regulator
LISSAVSLIFIVLVAGAQAALAQNTLTGEWTASIAREKSDRINLSFKRQTEKGSKNQMGTSFDFTDLQGLSREQVMNGGPVKFSLAREAGTIECEGSFQNGKGSGTFRFTGNQGFVSGMKTRGFDFEKPSRDDEREPEHRLFAATVLNVTTALADDLLSAGFGKLEVGDLFKAAIFKVDSKFMREMKDSGFPNLGMEELVKARIFKIDADFVRQAVQLGFSKESFESLVKMRIFKVTPEFIAEARNEGLTDLSVEDLVKMRIFRNDDEFIRQAKAEGVPLEVEKLVEKRIGVRRQ